MPIYPTLLAATATTGVVLDDFGTSEETARAVQEFMEAVLGRPISPGLMLASMGEVAEVINVINPGFPLPNSLLFQTLYDDDGALDIFTTGLIATFGETIEVESTPVPEDESMGSDYIDDFITLFAGSTAM